MCVKVSKKCSFFWGSIQGLLLYEKDLYSNTSDLDRLLPVCGIINLFKILILHVCQLIYKMKFFYQTSKFDILCQIDKGVLWTHFDDLIFGTFVDCQWKHLEIVDAK